jgi:serralysin
MGGVTVAAGDVDGDGLADVVTGAGPGAPGGHLKVFNGRTFGEMLSIFAYPGFSGGINVAVGDVNGDGHGDVITGAGPGAPNGHLKVFSGLDFSELLSVFAYPGFTGGVTVAAGDLNGDGKAEIITGAAALAPHVKVFDGATLQERGSFMAYPGAPVGVRVAVAGGRIITAPAGVAPHVKLFDSASLQLTSSFMVSVPVAQGGLFLAGD